MRAELCKTDLPSKPIVKKSDPSSSLFRRGRVKARGGDEGLLSILAQRSAGGRRFAGVPSGAGDLDFRTSDEAILSGATVDAEAVFKSLHQAVNTNAHSLHCFGGLLLLLLKIPHRALKILHVCVKASLGLSKGNLVDRHVMDYRVKFAHLRGKDSLLFQQKLYGFLNVHWFYYTPPHRGGRRRRPARGVPRCFERRDASRGYSVLQGWFTSTKARAPSF